MPRKTEEDILEKQQPNVAFDDDDDEEDDDDYVPTKDNDDETDKDSCEDDDDEPEKNGENEQKSTEIDENKMDELWKDFCNDDKKPATKPESNTENGSHQSSSRTVTKEYDFAGEIVTVKEIDGRKQKTIIDEKKPPPKPVAAKRPAGGVAALLSQLKKPKISTLKKSLYDWNEYKETNNMEEELDQHRRSKGSYLGKQAFLSRADLREFEQEKSVRDHQRRIRDMKNNNN